MSLWEFLVALFIIDAIGEGVWVLQCFRSLAGIRQQLPSTASRTSQRDSAQEATGISMRGDTSGRNGFELSELRALDLTRFERHLLN